MDPFFSIKSDNMEKPITESTNHRPFLRSKPTSQQRTPSEAMPQTDEAWCCISKAGSSAESVGEYSV